MHPDFLGGRLEAYGVFFFAGLIAGTACSIYRARLHGFGGVRVVGVLVALAALALGGAKIYSVLERGGLLGAWPRELSGAFRFPGGVIGAGGGLLALRFVAPAISLPSFADMVAPSCALAMSIVRVGCFLAGCCTGRVCDLPWSITFPAKSQAWHQHLKAGLLEREAISSLSVHPLQLYFALWSLVVFTALLVYEPRKRFDGELALLYLVLAGGGKFVLEQWRFAPVEHVQYASLALALCGAAGLVAVRLISQRKALE